MQNACLFHHIHRKGGGDDLAPAAAGVLLEYARGICRRILFGFCFGIESADRLGGVLEGGIRRVNFDLRDQRHHIFCQTLGMELMGNGVLEVVANIALTHGAALGERYLRLDNAVGGAVAQPEIDHADLRAVAVGNDQLMTLCNKIDDRFGGVADLRFLFFRRIAESIPAQCYYDSRYGAQ